MVKNIRKWAENILGVLLDFLAVVSLFGYTLPKELCVELFQIVFRRKAK